MSNGFSLSINDSCARLNNAYQIMVRLTMSTNAKQNNNIAKKNGKAKRTVIEITIYKFTFIRIKQGAKKIVTLIK